MKFIGYAKRWFHCLVYLHRPGEIDLYGSTDQSFELICCDCNKSFYKETTNEQT